MEKARTNFVGGKLRLKNSNVVKEVKKIVTKDVSKIKRGEDVKEIDNDKIIAVLDDEEEKYMNELADQVKKEKSEVVDYRTEAEKLFDERRMKLLPEKIKKNILVTYKQRYEKFQKTLSKLPEHYDIPKVGPG